MIQRYYSQPPQHFLKINHYLEGDDIEMPRNARVFSHSGIYHIMLRGINHQQIFYDEEDFHYFVHLLERFKKVCGYELYAYCLMGNHIHLLLRVKDEPLEIISGALEVLLYIGII